MFGNNIERLAKDNENFRKVLVTGKHTQVVAMSLPGGMDIGEEVHASVDQLFLLVDGRGEVVMNGETMVIVKDDLFFVPAGTIHNVINTGEEILSLITMYSPPQHPDGTVHKTKADAKE